MVNKNNVLIKISEHPTTQFWKLDFNQLTLPEQVFRCIWELESEVNNGGFEQYYMNSSGDTAFAVEGALKRIGAHKCAKIVHCANDLFPRGEPPRDQRERQNLWSSICEESMEQLDELDQEFFQYPDDLSSLLYDYVMNHREEIRGL
jgi:hypothetical protein